MLSAFIPRPPQLLSNRQRPRNAVRCPTSQMPPPRLPNSRRVRIPRKYTSESKNWEWGGRKSKSVGWRNLFNMEEGVIKVIEALWSKSWRVSESPILARMTALGARVLKSVTEAIERTLYPDTEKELVVEYGLTEPDEDDKDYVDPLREWETSKVTYYRDSFGRRVYLQLDGASGLVAATDYRDLHDEVDAKEDDAEEDGDEGQPFSILRSDDPFAAPEGFSRPDEFSDPKDWPYDAPPRL